MAMPFLVLKILTGIGFYSYKESGGASRCHSLLGFGFVLT